MKTSIFLTSFLSTNCNGSNPFTSPAIRAEWCVASNRVIGPMPLWPAQSASQFASVPMPTGDTRPTPVTTTRLLNPPPERQPSRAALHDVVPAAPKGCAARYGHGSPEGLHCTMGRAALKGCTDDCYFFLL